jgi:hypothetical protein
MKDIFKIFLILLFFTSCSKKSQEVECKKVLDTISKIKIIELGYGKGIIFPAALSKKFFTDTGSFTLNEKKVRYIDSLFVEKYDSLLTYFQKERKLFSIKKKDLQFYDKQFFGIIDKKKDSIAYCLIFNLTKSNPYNMKQKILKEDAEGSGFWFDENMFIFEYNLQTKKFSTPYYY